MFPVWEQARLPRPPPQAPLPRTLSPDHPWWRGRGFRRLGSSTGYAPTPTLSDSGGLGETLAQAQLCRVIAFPREDRDCEAEEPGQRYLGRGGGGMDGAGRASPAYSPGLGRPFWIPKFLSPKGAERTLVPAGCGRPSRSTSPTTPPPQFGALQVSPSLLTWSPVVGLGSARPRLTPSPGLVHLSPGRIAQIYKLGEGESPPEQQGG